MKTKKEIKYFTIYEYEKEGRYLRQQHLAGWKFVKMTGLCVYHFEECQPEDVVYQLDYNQEATSDRDGYVQMFADCGWEYLQDYMGYSYFRKPAAQMHGDEEIFCDDSSRLAMLERVNKGRLTPLLIIFAAVLLPQFLTNLTAGRYGVAALLGGMLLLYIGIFVYGTVRYRQLKQKS